MDIFEYEITPAIYRIVCLVDWDRMHIWLGLFYGRVRQFTWFYLTFRIYFSAFLSKYNLRYLCKNFCQTLPQNKLNYNRKRQLNWSLNQNYAQIINYRLQFALLSFGNYSPPLLNLSHYFSRLTVSSNLMVSDLPSFRPSGTADTS
jgi:hypothetical protein